MSMRDWSILSISLLTIMAGAAVAPALASIRAGFPEVSPTTVKLVLTLPSLCIIPLTFVSERLTRRFGKRRVLLTGISLYLLGGLGGGLATSFAMLLGTRVVLGLGVGLMLPMSSSLIADFHEGEARLRMMGRSAASSNLGGVVALVCSGWLASLDWRLSFGVYALAVVTLLLVAFRLPEPARPAATGAAAAGGLPPAALLGGLGLCLLMVVFYCVPANMALFLVSSGIGDASKAGVTLGLVTSAGFAAGLLLPRSRRAFGQGLPLVMLICMAGGFFLLHGAARLTEAWAGVALVGLGYGSLWPWLIAAMSQAVERRQTMLTMALAGSSIFFGQFVSPLVFDGAGMLLGDHSPRTLFLLAGLTAAASAPLVWTLRPRLLRLARLAKRPSDQGA